MGRFVVGSLINAPSGLGPAVVLEEKDGDLRAFTLDEPEATMLFVSEDQVEPYLHGDEGLWNRSREILDAPRSKDGFPLEECDVVAYDVFGPGPGRPYQEPEGVVNCFVVHIDKAGEVYLDPRADPSYREIILKASPDQDEEDWDETGWVLMCGNSSEEIELIGKKLKF